ncbi:hypothetical protein D3C75_544270 [compost metagenome]
MDSDHLNQVSVAFETQLLAIGVTVRFRNLLSQPAHQRMFTDSLRGFFLQQLADM